MASPGYKCTYTSINRINLKTVANYLILRKLSSKIQSSKQTICDHFSSNKIDVRGPQILTL